MYASQQFVKHSVDFGLVIEIIAHDKRLDYTWGMFGSLSVPEVSAEEVKQASDTRADVVILDVRTPEEYAKSHIAASISLPVDEVPGKIQVIIPDKKKKVYVYCLSGSRSAPVVDAMRQAGYENVYHLPSGLLAWRAKQYPLVTE